MAVLSWELNALSSGILLHSRLPEIMLMLGARHIVREQTLSRASDTLWFVAVFFVEGMHDAMSHKLNK